METFVCANSLALPPLEFIVMYVDLGEDGRLEGVGVEIWQPPLWIILILLKWIAFLLLHYLEEKKYCAERLGGLKHNSGSAPVQSFLYRS